jgi:hypothetical protein
MATGISISSTSNLSSGQKILVANALVANEPEAPDPDLVNNQTIPAGHKQWDVLTYARLSQASALTEGVDLSQSEQLVASSTSITPSEHGLIVTISKRLVRRQGDTNVVSTAGTQIGQSLRRREANDIIALYALFSKVVGSSSTTLDVNSFRGSVAYLLTDNDTEYGPAPMPLNAALHIEQISEIIADITDPGSTTARPAGFGDDLLQRWWKGSDRLYAVAVFHSGNITRDAGNDAKGAIFNKGAIELVRGSEAEATEETDNSLRAVEYGIFQEWGEAERADPHGVCIYSDAETTV